MIDSVVTKVLYVGDGQTTVFPFPFPFDNASDVKVRIYDEETQKEQPVTKDFYLDEEAHAIVYPGYAPGQNPPDGSRPPVLGEKQRLAIYRETPVMQLVDLGNKYPMPTIEKLSDKLTMVVQEIEEKLGRCIMSYITDSKTAEEIIDQIHADSLNATKQAEVAANSAAAAKYSELKTDQALENIQEDLDRAEAFSKEAAANANKSINAVAAINAYSVPAWQAGKVYSYPEVVAYIDGQSYRCTGQNITSEPTKSQDWVPIVMRGGDDFWEIDMEGGMQPQLFPRVSNNWELDTDGNIMPKGLLDEAESYATSEAQKQAEAAARSAKIAQDAAEEAKKASVLELDNDKNITPKE